MTAKEAIKELKDIRNYCTARSIPAVDYAIEVLAELEQKQEEGQA